MVQETNEKYMDSLNETAQELIVRIVWVQQNAPKPEAGSGLCRARARFDLAVDIQNDEIIGKGQMNWLEWTFKKKLFGNPFGYSLKKGSLYRIRVRRKENSAANEAVYYLDSVLEENVSDRRLDPILSFTDTFEDNETEMIFLNKKSVSGWGVFWGYKRICLTYLAFLAEDDQRLCRKTGRIFLMEKNPDSRLKAGFEDLTAYRLRVRKSRNEADTYLCTKVCGKADISPFVSLIKEYTAPVVIEDPLGRFALDRRWNWFEGTIQWCSEPCQVLMDVPEGSSDCSDSLSLLRKICADIPSFDRKVRRQICDQTFDLLAEWYDKEITEQEYMQKIGMPSIQIEDGRICFSFDCGELFAGHILQADVDPDGNVLDTDLAG